jgi:hypothetical protein
MLRFDVDETSSIFEKYSKLVGSDQIATRFALRIISKHLNEHRPKSILEIGAGIGTITELLIRELPTAKIFSYENNAWCISQLVKNINQKQVQIITSHKSLLQTTESDFLIIDDYLDEEITFALISRIKPESVFIEGHRRRQRLYVVKSYKKMGWKIDFKNYRKSFDSNKGGCIIIKSNSVFDKTFIYLSFIYLTLALSELSRIRAKFSVRKLLAFRTFYKS